jgi:hypothetical protein
VDPVGKIMEYSLPLLAATSYASLRVVLHLYRSAGCQSVLSESSARRDGSGSRVIGFPLCSGAFTNDSRVNWNSAAQGSSELS